LNVSLYIAKRYLFSKSSQNAINIINLFTAGVVVIGALALFIVLAGFAGLKTFSLSFANSFDPDLKAVALEGKSFTISPEQLVQLNQLEGIAHYSKIVEERVLLRYNDKTQLAQIKGVDQAFSQVTNIDSLIPYGSWIKPMFNQSVIGLGISNSLGLTINNYANLLEIIVPKPGKGSVISATSAPYYSKLVLPVGFYNIDPDTNKKYVFTEIELARDLLRYEENQVTGVEFKLDKTLSEEAVIENIEAIFNNKILVKNRAQQNDALYKMLNTENVAVYLIFTLILIIALFNVVGSTIMSILDKKKNLKTLFAMGITIKKMKRIFFLQGALLSVFGGLTGIVLGSLIVGAQILFNLVYVPGTTLPYPMELKLSNYLIVFLTISVLGIMASKIASVRISKQLME
jgi:lipoprotein-releasing system permease protein